MLVTAVNFSVGDHILQTNIVNLNLSAHSTAKQSTNKLLYKTINGILKTFYDINNVLLN